MPIKLPTSVEKMANHSFFSLFWNERVKLITHEKDNSRICSFANDGSHLLTSFWASNFLFRGFSFASLVTRFAIKFSYARAHEWTKPEMQKLAHHAKRQEGRCSFTLVLFFSRRSEQATKSAQIWEKLRVEDSIARDNSLSSVQTESSAAREPFLDGTSKWIIHPFAVILVSKAPHNNSRELPYQSTIVYAP